MKVPQEQSQSQSKNQKNEKTEHLAQSNAGMYLASNHAKMIWQGNKSLIVKSMDFRDSVGKSFYLMGGNACYGVITIKSIAPITLKQFKDLSSKHRVTQREKEEWWAHKKGLFAYEFDFKKFDPPRTVAVPANVQTFVDEVKFLTEEEVKKSIEPFKPIKLQKPSKEFEDEKELADYLFGGN